MRSGIQRTAQWIFVAAFVLGIAYYVWRPKPPHGAAAVDEVKEPGKPRAGIRPVSDPGPKRIGDVVFVHGLRGDDRETWQGDPNDEANFWPKWLGEDFPDVGVHCVWYPAKISDWEGSSMPFQDRAKSLLNLLYLNKIGTTKPVVFIGHSLGGIVIKQMLRKSGDGTDVRWKTVAPQTRGVIFLATPHTGSNLAVYLERIGRLSGLDQYARQSQVSAQLKANEPQLRELNEWYVGGLRQSGIASRSFYETADTWPGIRVVDETSGGGATMSGFTAVGIDANHIEIAKPASRDEPVYLSTKDFIAEMFSLGTPWDVTLDEFFHEYKKHRDRDDVDGFNRDFGGRQVTLTGIVDDIHGPKPDDPTWTPAYVLAVSDMGKRAGPILVTFDPDRFRASVRKGDKVTIKGSVAKNNDADGVKVHDCQVLDNPR